MTNEQAIKMQMRIKKIRTDNKLKQAEFGQQFNVSGSTISGYENGATQVPLDILILIALKYNVSLDYIAGRTNYKQGANNPELTEDELLLIKKYRQLSERSKGKHDVLIQQLLEQQEKT